MTEKWRGITLDPNTGKVEEVFLEPIWKSIAPAIDCETFDVVRLDDRHDLWVDDEGLLKPFGPGVIVIRGYGQPIAGKVLILSHDDEGNSLSCTWTIEEARQRVGFGTLIQSRGRKAVVGDFGLMAWEG